MLLAAGRSYAMRSWKAVAWCAALSFSSASIRAQAPGTARRATAAEALKGIHSLMELPRGTDRQTVIQQLRRVFPALEEMEKQHPKAKELAEARTLAVAAASFLAGAGKDASMVPKAEAIAQKVLTSDAPAEMKLRADALGQDYGSCQV